MDIGHIDHTPVATANVTDDLVLLVETVLTRRGSQLMPEHVPGALAPPQTDHGLTPLPPGAAHGARHAGQAGDGDGQGQRPTASQKSLLRCFLSRLHVYLISVRKGSTLANYRVTREVTSSEQQHYHTSMHIQAVL